VPDRPVRASILWPRRRRSAPEKWYLLSPIGSDANRVDAKP